MGEIDKGLEEEGEGEALYLRGAARLPVGHVTGNGQMRKASGTVVTGQVI